MTHPQPTPEVILAQMRSDTQLWNDLLWCSGGMLELAKCSYHFLYSDFFPDGEPTPRLGQVGSQMSVTDSSDTLIIIPSKSVYDTHKTLGHFKSPAGTGKTQLTALLKKMSSLAQTLTSCPASRSEATIFYETIYLPSIFVLGQCFFDPRDLDNAEKKSMPSLFAKQGFNRNTRRSLLYGPSDYGGGGHIRWRWLQGAQQLTNFLKYWRTDGCVSDALRIAVSWMQQNAGVGFPLFADPTISLPYIEGRWLPSLRNFLCSIQGSIQIDTTYVPLLQRRDDKHLMDIARVSNIFTDKDLARINYCRLYMNVVTVADLCEPDGIYISKGAFVGALEFMQSFSTDIPSEQARPNGSSWNKWRQLLNLIASSESHRLHLPLGPWLLGGNTLRRRWHSYYDTETRCLYRRVNHTFYRYEQFDSHFINGCSDDWLPTALSFPVTPTHISADIWSIPSLESIIPSSDPASLLNPVPKPSIAPTFLDFIQQETGSYDYLKEHIEMIYEPHEILHLIHKETQHISSLDDEHLDQPYLILCSDGSDMLSSMSYGWVFAMSSGTRLAQGRGPALGSNSSHRAEGTGMLSGSIFVHLLFKYLVTPPPCPLRYYCDNKGLITRIQARSQYADNYPNATLAPDWDLVEEIHQLNASISPLFKHVKGHQDSSLQYKQLSLPAQLNVDADALAGSYHKDFPPDDEPLNFEIFPHTRAHLHIQNHTITSHFLSNIYYYASIDDYQQSLREINNWTTTTFDLIHQDSLKRAIRSYCHRKLFLFKFQHGLLPTQEFKAQWEPCSASCPLCLLPDTQEHYLQCSHKLASEPRRAALQRFNQLLDTVNTDFELRSFIIDSLESFFNPSRTHQVIAPASCRQCNDEQNLLGWHSFLRGYWPESWAHHQHDFYRRQQLLDYFTTGQTWQTKITRGLWDLAYEMWLLHNTHVHGHNIKRSSRDLRLRLVHRIRHLHSFQQSVMYAHRDSLFMPNLSQTLHRSTTKYLQNWLNQYESTILSSMEQARLESLRNTPAIYTYFRTTKAPTKGRSKPHIDGKFRTKWDATNKKKRNRPASVSTRSKHFIPYYFRHHRKQSARPTTPRDPILNPYSSTL